MTSHTYRENTFLIVKDLRSLKGPYTPPKSPNIPAIVSRSVEQYFALLVLHLYRGQTDGCRWRDDL